MTTLTIEQKENLIQRCIYVRRRVQEVGKNVLAGMTHQLGYVSGFGSYYGSVQKSNCADCPDCGCVEGPSIEEARRDFRAMHNAGIGIWFLP